MANHAEPVTMAGGFVEDAEAQARFAARRRYLAWRGRLLPVAAVIVFLLVWWQAVEIFDIKPFIAPSPVAVAQVLYTRFDMLMANLLPTAIESVSGFMLGNLAAISLAAAFVYRKTMEEALFPIAVMVNTIPVVAKAPILVLLLGNGMEPKIAIAAIICFFPTLVNMTRGLRDVRSEQLELMRVLSATPREVFMRIRVPNALPYLFSALKIAASTAVIGAIVGEWIGSTKGIGALIIQSTYNFDSPLLYATIVVGSTFSALFFGVISLIERRVLRWNVPHNDLKKERPMTATPEFVTEPAGRVPVAASSDLVVVGGGPAGIAAALAGARNGLSVTLLERYPYLGGLASGGMVLVLDDMCNGQEIAVRGLCADLIARLERLGLAVTPPEADRRSDAAMWRKWSRWGVFDFTSHLKPQPIVYAAAFDPDGFKRVSNEMIAEAKINLRLHSWFSRAIVEDGAIKGVVCESKEGRQAILGKIVVDATGDLDVAASAGAPFIEGAYIVTTVFRLGGVNIEEAERFEYEEPEAFKAIDREAKRTIGGSWDKWWLKTPLPGVVWCNCPHMANYDGLKVDDLTRADFEGRKRIAALLDFLHAKMPGFRDCYVVDVAPQLGIRQTRLLEGLYVVTKEDVTERRHFADSVARGRDYYTPYRSLLPRDVKGLVVAGRHYSATSSAQRMSREIPPCMAMGEAAGEAAALALEGGVALDGVDVGKLQARLRARGADPGDRPAANATVLRAAE